MMLTAHTCEFTELTAPCSVSVNTPFNVQGRIKNLNTNNWGTFPLDFYLSLDRIWSEEDKHIGSCNVTLGTYEWKSFAAILDIGNEFYSGKYFIIARTPLGNEMYREIELINPNQNLGPDLAPSNLFFWDGAKPGSSFKFSYTLNNLGLLPSGISRVRYYWSLGNNVVDANDLMVYQTFISSSIQPNSRLEFTVTHLTIPANSIPGQVYYLIVKVDADNWVSETIEWNNTVSRRIEIPTQFAPNNDVDERTDLSTAIDDITPPVSFAISPNPATDYLNVTFQIETPATVSAEVYDQSGRVVSNIAEQEFQPGDYSERIGLSDTPNGIYLVRIVIDGKPTTKKVVVQR